MKLLLFSFFIGIGTLAFSQKWKQMAQDPQVNIYDVVTEAEAYFDTIDIYAKGSGWKGFQRWLYENERKFYPSGDRSQVDPYYAEKAFQEFSDNTPESSLFSAGWESLGPYDIEQQSGNQRPGMGRVESYYADPNDPNIIYLGSRSGGFHRSIDGGATWSQSTTDFLIASGVNTMTARPTDSDSVLINVRNSLNGTTQGIYRSIDGGLTWNVTAFNPINLGWGGLGTNRQIFDIKYHPTTPNLVFISSNEGVFRSSDDLQTWTEVISINNARRIHFHPTDPNVVYTFDQGTNFIYVSADGGQTFTPSNPFPNGIVRQMSTSLDCPNCVYVTGNDYISKSLDQGMNFTTISAHGISNYGGFAVSDLDTSIILIGNIEVHMSTDGGNTFTQTTYGPYGSPTYVHSDTRGARCENGVFWINTDGFLGRSLDNGISWELFEGMSIRENYALGQSQSNHERTMCGSQDVGSSLHTENQWIEVFDADGMESIIHPLNDDWMVGSWQYGGRFRSKNGGLSFDYATPPGQNGGWVAPLVYDPNNHMKIYSFGDTIFRSTDFGSSWTTIGTPSFNGTINHAVISEGNSQKMVVSRGQDLELSFTGGSSFFDIQGSLPSASISDICFDPNDDNTIAVVYSSYQSNGEKVYISFNNGLTWNNITYNLGNLPVRSIVIDHTDASTIYLGTEIGVYKKGMADNTWSLYNPDLPNVSVREMEVMYGSNTLRAVTWGRGLWEFTLDGRADYPAILTTDINDAPTDETPLEGVDQFVTSVISYDGTLSNAYVEWSLNAPIFGNVIPMTNTMDSTWVSDQPLPNAAVGTTIFFKVYAVGSAGDTSETYKFMYEVKPDQYCESYGNMGWQTSVTLIDFNTINNATGKTQPYTDYTASDWTYVEQGETYDLSMNVNTDGTFTIYGRAWIDWNRDFDFNDPGETYELGSAQNTPNGPTSLSPLVITVPANASLGLTTMRVAAKYNQTPDTCETGFDGEVEDYGIHIIPACQPLVSQEFITVCDSIIWNGNVYNASGTYIVSFTNTFGCDSTAWLNLTVEQLQTDIDSTVCFGLTWNGTQYNTSGTYQEVLTSANGCDSSVTLNLIVEDVNSNVTQGGIVLTAESTTGTFQWIDCDNGNMAILGATNPSYIATANGNYAVVVTTGNCVDTSACFVVDAVSLNENLLDEVAIVAPNPSNGNFSIYLNKFEGLVNITVYDAAGKLILEDNKTNVKSLDYSIETAPGTYYLQVQLAERTGVFTLLIQ
jgi:hypothetical protein